MLFIFTQINNYNDWTCEFMAKGQWNVFLITANKKETKYDYKPATSTESQDLWIFHTVSEAIQANMQQYSNKLILLVFFFCRTKKIFTILFLQEGGGWCWDEESCTSRLSQFLFDEVQGPLASSANWESSVQLTGIFNMVLFVFLPRHWKSAARQGQKRAQQRS